MSDYFNLVEKNKANFRLEYLLIINDETAQVSYSILTNLHCDFGIQSNLMAHMHTTRRSKIRKALASYQRATGKKLRLSETRNSLGYTRLVYTLK